MALTQKRQSARLGYSSKLSSLGIPEKDADKLGRFYGDVFGAGDSRLSTSSERSAYSRHSKKLRKAGFQFPGLIGKERRGSSPAASSLSVSDRHRANINRLGAQARLSSQQLNLSVGIPREYDDIRLGEI